VHKRIKNDGFVCGRIVIQIKSNGYLTAKVFDKKHSNCGKDIFENQDCLCRNGKKL
jgi:hypothetical protein